MSEGPANGEDVTGASQDGPEAQVNIAKRLLMVAMNLILAGIASVLIVIAVHLWNSDPLHASQPSGPAATSTVPVETATPTLGASIGQSTNVATATPSATVVITSTATPTATVPAPTRTPVYPTPTPTISGNSG